MNDKELDQAREHAQMRNHETVHGTNEANRHYIPPAPSPNYTEPTTHSSSSSYSSNKKKPTSRAKSPGQTKTTTKTSNPSGIRGLIAFASFMTAGYYIIISQDEVNLIIAGIGAIVAAFIGYKLYKAILVILICVSVYYIYQYLES